ncbi:D-arabinono-1,4-lactone oxidase [Streptomyces sp. WMMB303]|uniref:D-arabinono-1,4-lactone oxidase n=1 Tax=Streptomyces sp. WMMB303 TaxID=3034154 RepID=UPI0023EDE61B|nr:D-arabinono-1,4-lactone oxidase [Streptomyces sp. WMMB303]MDF4251742.1 D-arabinono-1,4-lactone oxidase [Streptomyces sp. WMMB303]
MTSVTTARQPAAGRGVLRDSRWRTWAGTVECAPARTVRPTGEEELVRAVRKAARDGLSVRAAGTGHSFNRLVPTSGALIDLTGYTGIVALDTAAGEVTVRAGTRFTELCAGLHRRGMALPNIGTLAEQTVGGALSTGNHGTGLRHRALSGDVTRVRLVTADGRVRGVGPGDEAELWGAVRCGLGTLGVLSTVTLRCVPQFRLRSESATERLDALLERFEDWAAGSEHPSLGWLPWSDQVTVRSVDRTDEPVTPGAGFRRLAATLDEVRCGVTGQAARLAGAEAVPRLTARLGGLWPDGPYVDASHRVFTFAQPVRFLAMEHALPLERTPDALRALRTVLRQLGIYSPYSVLVRVGAADDVPLSPAYGRPTGYVNLTVPRAAGQVEILRAVEPVLRDHGARPHWGKAHTATAEVLAGRYPGWAEFQRVRSRLDPSGMFAGPYTDTLLGPAPAPVAEPAVAAGRGAR